MCRLVAYQGAPLPLHSCVFGGTHSLFRQSWAPQELRSGSVNVDGYGVTWLPEDATELVRLARVEPIWHDPDLAPLLRSVRSTTVLAALRNATPGLPVSRTALLPLIHRDRALVLNGYVPGFREGHMRALRARLRDDWYGRLMGSGDAETLFLRVLQSLEDGLEPGAALVGVAEAVRERLEDDETAPLTLVLQEPEGLTALHLTWNGPVNSLYLGEALPLAPQGVLLASEPLTGTEWEPVPPHTLVRIRAAGVTLEAI
ncbi:MAG: hypothetical protein P8188_13545 [Gemmatimonadota bacterium]